MAQGYQKPRHRQGICPGLLRAGGRGKHLFQQLFQTALGHQVLLFDYL